VKISLIEACSDDDVGSIGAWYVAERARRAGHTVEMLRHPKRGFDVELVSLHHCDDFPKLAHMPKCAPIRIVGGHPMANNPRPAIPFADAICVGEGESWISEALTRKERLCVHAGAHNVNLIHGGALFFFGAFMPPGRFEPRHAVIRRICDDLAEHGPDPEIFEEKLRRFRTRFAGERYSVETQLRRFGDAELQQGDYRKYESSLADLSGVTPARIQKLAQTLFAKENTCEMNIVPENQKWWMPLAGLAMKAWQR